MDKERDGKLSFLDLLIKRYGNSLLFSIYRKPTFSGLGTSFFSYCQYKFKVNAVRTLLHRAFSLSSTYTLFHEEIVFLKQYFINNGYHVDLFHKLVKQFLNNVYQPKAKVPTVSKEKVYITIPYLGRVSKTIEETLLKYFVKFYPQINFNIIHSNNYKINSFFKFKDKVLPPMRSAIVYCYTWPSCQAGYIGSTTRAFKVRIAEHMGQSSRTGLPLHTPPHSAVREHAYQCNVGISKDHFKIIDSCNRLDLRILESLYIKTKKPSLNNMLSAAPLNIL